MNISKDEEFSEVPPPVLQNADETPPPLSPHSNHAQLPLKQEQRYFYQKLIIRFCCEIKTNEISSVYRHTLQNFKNSLVDEIFDRQKSLNMWIPQWKART